MAALTYTYKTLPGFFIQDDPWANPISIGPVPKRFGLSDASDDRWAKFQARVDGLNREATVGVQYKVFFLGRHGEGYHNVAEAKYGTLAWDDHWSLLNTDGELIWGPDPLLTPLGEAQARTAHSVWTAERSLPNPIPLPELLYSSPLTRAMHTNVLTFDGGFGVERLNTMVLENLREECGAHTCDKRRSLTYIHRSFPSFVTEDGFTEEDELWTTQREAWNHVVERARKVMDYLSGKNGTYISITAHGGTINAILEVVGRPRYALPTGGILPIIVESTTITQ